MRILKHFRDLLARLLRSWGALEVTLGSIGDYLRVQGRFLLDVGVIGDALGLLLVTRAVFF